MGGHGRSASSWRKNAARKRAANSRRLLAKFGHFRLPQYHGNAGKSPRRSPKFAAPARAQQPPQVLDVAAHSGAQADLAALDVAADSGAQADLAVLNDDLFLDQHLPSGSGLQSWALGSF